MNQKSSSMVLGFDPGRDKCGVAIADNKGKIYYHEVVESSQGISTLNNLIEQFSINFLVMGNQTTSKQWKKQLESELLVSVPIVLIDERNSTLEARDRYWEMYPPQGLMRLLPKGMRNPPRPIDDIVAILLIERYFNSIK
ncbi:putative resolvase, RNase H-like fold [Crocosphaera subtropica ATCC 51142]|uniref:Resolvase, RNase H-like fold n=1 Tax=Crocosphaera subtropica (strain ATCC 51142 / BH68) TaxID=43989 RepID=B1WNH2_CROS5|nr:pre-16S rRNA-processing nuclease YqgF [Crocosphaera subtropica]ACB49814.1 putative resolvase, RNase H-like fold [Crocosphaera subtropica ATCC 51142]